MLYYEVNKNRVGIILKFNKMDKLKNQFQEFELTNKKELKVKGGAQTVITKKNVQTQLGGAVYEDTKYVKDSNSSGGTSGGGGMSSGI